LKIPSGLVEKNSLLGLLGGIAILGVIVLLIIGVVYLALNVKTFEFVKNAGERLKRMIIFNFLIRYY
jgi:hypothetical protein